MSTTLSIFSRAEWAKFYPQAEYATSNARVKDHTVHFWLGLDQPEKDTIGLIQTYAEKAKTSPAFAGKLTRKDEKNYNWTPLHIAVMQGKKNIVIALIAIESVRNTINTLDAYGWTPLHHTALLSPADPAVAREMKSSLESAGGNIALQTRCKGTYKDILALTAKGSDLSSLSNIYLLGEPISLAKVQALFGNGVDFRNIHYFSLEHRTALWMQEEQEERLGSFEQKILLNSLKLPKKEFEITTVHHGGKEIPNFYGLSAKVDMPAGTVVGHYVGRYCPQLDLRSFQSRFETDVIKDCEYRMDSFRADTVRNHTAFTNYGFTNVVPLAVSLDGISEYVFLCTAEDLKAGDPIYMDYGANHHLCYGPQMLFNAKAMRAYFKDGLDAIWRKYDSHRLEFLEFKEAAKKKEDANLEQGSSFVRSVLAKHRILYVVQNPVALLYLHYSDTMSLEAWKKVLNFELGLPSSRYHEMIVSWGKENGLNYFNILRLIDWLEPLDKEIKRKSSNDYPFYQNWVLEHLETMSLMNLTKAISWMQEELSKPKRTMSDVALAASIDERLKDYDWSKDPQNLYSFESRKAGYAQYYNNVTKANVANMPQKAQNDPTTYYKEKIRVLEEIIDMTLTINADAITDESYQILLDIKKGAEEALQNLSKK